MEVTSSHLALSVETQTGLPALVTRDKHEGRDTITVSDHDGLYAAFDTQHLLEAVKRLVGWEIEQ